MRAKAISGPVLLLVAAAALLALPAAASAAPKKRAYKFGSRTLKVGTRGKDVRVLQRSLNALAIATPVNGRFRPTTRKSVKRLEKRRRWKVNGIVSRREAKKIRKLLRRRGSVYFLYGGYYPTVTVSARRGGTARVEVIDTASAAAVAAIPISFARAGEIPVAWNETASAGGWAPDGTYQLRIADPGTAAASITGGQTQPFLLRARAFPVRGAHNFGGAGARFGAPRSGHTHQGQDVMAACGLPLVAAEGGTVWVKAYQASGAGHYLVIRGAISGTDYVYMHLQAPTPVLKGQIVYTNQLVGSVGTTGSSSGCHLHFEHWTAPGWYQGGAPYDPLPELLYWDSNS